MADTVDSLVARMHELLVVHLTQGPAVPAEQDVLSSLGLSFLGAPRRVDVAAGLHDLIARAGALGTDGTWLVAAGHASLAGMAVAGGRADQALLHLDAAVTAGFNDCVALHVDPIRPLHHDPRFQALYRRIRITQGDLDEYFWLHAEMQALARDVSNASVDNVGRLDTGVSPLPMPPMPTREPDTPGVLITRIDLAATRTALQQAVMKAEFQRSAGNTSLSLIDDTWDLPRARHDARYADEADLLRRRAAEARAFVERPGAGSVPAPCPPLGSLTYPA
ncbi:hypothetical protein NRK68_32375 [Streptomyces yangpuensis]|uniref:Uncharacterized protein n=2 Tax=Streptomyces yangpuensis TaxID=1648182 RepID=A0ABY5Q5Q6_9ACTN|nr:hypothetical protein [Streptomyces yangpuensis]MBZ9599966.1 hypothetical protein [Streptomyces erythrochromogenes]UUY51527.1 hypothetical protein NRK68_32375 [Streptomyces yangpuensis]